MTSSGGSIAVVIPTRDRPDKLARCLEALATAREHIKFDVVVCDSSRLAATRDVVAATCAQYPYVSVSHHSGTNVAAARNACARAASADLLVNVDDDVYVEPDAVVRLVDAYRARRGPRVVAGSVAWNDTWSRPVVMRPIGYGRPARPGEAPDFLIGAFFAYSRALALTWPWNERIRTSDDRFMGALWRAKGVALLFEPTARAVHDDEHVTYSVDAQRDFVYANLFDAVIARRSVARALSYEVLGFLAGTKAFVRRRSDVLAYLSAWLQGHLLLIGDRPRLRDLLARDLPRGAC